MGSEALKMQKVFVKKKKKLPSTAQLALNDHWLNICINTDVKI